MEAHLHRKLVRTNAEACLPPRKRAFPGSSSAATVPSFRKDVTAELRGLLELDLSPEEFADASRSAASAAAEVASAVRAAAVEKARAAVEAVAAAKRALELVALVSGRRRRGRPRKRRRALIGDFDENDEGSVLEVNESVDSVDSDDDGGGGKKAKFRRNSSSSQILMKSRDRKKISLKEESRVGDTRLVPAKAFKAASTAY
ncbi:hypothetical protein QJS04_geneDACA009784 [Acorus gramineus]|uniref:Uncharacterized protein n=1 Tax=Acorus gramineus TaxID=55184 RepID=A0AAV9B9W4_ACOGR|nr:hypothetical protein QJS04_geneDACA009784 [Acorus gramineus]